MSNKILLKLTNLLSHYQMSKNIFFLDLFLVNFLFHFYTVYQLMIAVWKMPSFNFISFHKSVINHCLCLPKESKKSYTVSVMHQLCWLKLLRCIETVSETKEEIQLPLVVKDIWSRIYFMKLSCKAEIRGIYKVLLTCKNIVERCLGKKKFKMFLV